MCDGTTDGTKKFKTDTITVAGMELETPGHEADET
jgi:hypothetical protein